MLNVISKPFRGRLINRAHPLSDGLVFAPILNEGVGINVLDHAWMRQGTLINGPVWYAGEQGLAIDLNGTNERVDFDPIVDLTNTPCTFIILCVVDATSTIQDLLSIHNSDNTNQSFRCYISSTGLGIAVLSDAITQYRITGTSVVGANVLYHLAYTYGGSSSYTSLAIYKNGIPCTYTSWASRTGNRIIGSGKWSIGGRYYDNTRNVNGKITACWAWNRLFSQSEIMQHYLDPWTMFSQPSRGKYAFVAGGTSRQLLAAIAGASSTPSISETMTRALNSGIAGTSSIPAVVATIVRVLLSAISGSSFTPDITATIAVIINLIASISGSTLTSDVAATIVRALISSIQAGSSTAEVIAKTTRNVLANIVASSNTPDITAIVENILSLAAAIVGVSLTPDIVSTMARNLITAITGQSLTPDITAQIARNLLANIVGTSVTPDDLILILGLFTWRENLRSKIQTALATVSTAETYNSIRQQIIDEIDDRLKGINY